MWVWHLNETPKKTSSEYYLQKDIPFLVILNYNIDVKKKAHRKLS